jgi:hypothetical protein
MLHDMHLAGLSERTHESYLHAVRKFAQWLDKSPDAATEDDLRRYLLFIKNDQGWEANSLKVAYSGLKFFSARTCPREWPTLSKLRVGKQTRLPAVLTTMTVTAEEFIRRFLQHVLPRGFQKVRHYGFAHPRRKTDYEWLKMLVTVTLHPVYVLIVAAAAPIVKHRPTCRHCGGPLTCVGFILATDWPFVPYDSS